MIIDHVDSLEEVCLLLVVYFFSIKVFVLVACSFEIPLFTELFVLLCGNESFDEWVENVSDAAAFLGHSKGGAIFLPLREASANVSEVLSESRPHSAVIAVGFTCVTT